MAKTKIKPYGGQGIFVLGKADNDPAVRAARLSRDNNPKRIVVPFTISSHLVPDFLSSYELVIPSNSDDDEELYLKLPAGYANFSEKQWYDISDKEEEEISKKKKENCDRWLPVLRSSGNFSQGECESEEPEVVKGQIYQSVSFNNSHLKELKFENCKFVSCSFSGISWFVTFESCSFSNCDFSKSQLFLLFQKCKLTGVKFDGSVIKTTFTRSTLTQCSFDFATLKDTTFDHSKITASSFDQTKLVMHPKLKHVPTNKLIASTDIRPWMTTAQGRWEHDFFLPVAPPLNPTSPEFQRWFGKSVVVDAEGKPLVLYHGTNTPWFTVFDLSRGEDHMSGVDIRDIESLPAVFLTDSEGLANTYVDSEPQIDPYAVSQPGDFAAGIYRLYVKMENPLIVDAQGAKWDKIPFGKKRTNTSELVRLAQKNKHDGLIVRNVQDAGDGRPFKGSKISTVYAVFDAKNMKSAAYNHGTWDPQDPDIRHNPRIRSNPFRRGQFAGLVLI